MKNAVTFYTNLKTEIEKGEIPLISIDQPQADFNLNQTLVIPFDENNNGLMLLLLKVNNEDVSENTSFALVITTSFSILKINKDKMNELFLIINDLNFFSTIPGWILDEKSEMIHYKYIYPSLAYHTKLDPQFFIFIKEIYQVVTKGIPVLANFLTGTYSRVDVNKYFANKS